MAHNGRAERAAIMVRLDGLAGGRGWRTQVPGSVTLPRFEDQRVKPYYVVRFARPFAIRKGRSLANESKQPHKLTFSVLSYAGDPDAAEDLASAIGDRLVGWQPNAPYATAIEATGGYAIPVADTGSYPERYLESAWYSTNINLGDPAPATPPSAGD